VTKKKKAALLAALVTVLSILLGLSSDEKPTKKKPKVETTAK